MPYIIIRRSYPFSIARQLVFLLLVPPNEPAALCWRSAALFLPVIYRACVHCRTFSDLTLVTLMPVHLIIMFSIHANSHLTTQASLESITKTRYKRRVARYRYRSSQKRAEFFIPSLPFVFELCMTKHGLLSVYEKLIYPANISLPF